MTDLNKNRKTPIPTANNTMEDPLRYQTNPPRSAIDNYSDEKDNHINELPEQDSEERAKTTERHRI